MKKTVLLLLSAALSTAVFADTFITVPKKKPKQVEQPMPTNYYQPPVMEEEKEMAQPKPMKKAHKPMVHKKVMAEPMMDEGEQFWIQLGAFRFEEKAVNRASEARSSCKRINIYQKDGLNKVIAGPFKTQEKAYKKLKQLRKVVKGAFLTQPENFK
jgi:cell division septation protein DedD